MLRITKPVMPTPTSEDVERFKEQELQLSQYILDIMLIAEKLPEQWTTRDTLMIMAILNHCCAQLGIRQWEEYLGKSLRT